MNLADHFKDFWELLIHFFSESFGFLGIDDFDTTFEIANDFFIRYWAWLVNFVIAKNIEPGFWKATSLASLNWDPDEGIIRVREQIFIILKLILVELAVVQISDLSDSFFFGEFIFCSL